MIALVGLCALLTALATGLGLRLKREKEEHAATTARMECTAAVLNSVERQMWRKDLRPHREFWKTVRRALAQYVAIAPRMEAKAPAVHKPAEVRS